MKNHLLGLLMVLFAGSAASSQQLNQYRYVQVPESFSFLKDNNQHQLNELTAFLLDKQGFEVFYGKEIPADVDFCEVLVADVENDSGLFITGLILHLKTCKGEVVFSSEKGKSREKDYRAGYHEALRDAFKSLEAADYTYTGRATSSNTAQPEKAAEPIAVEAPVREKVVAEKTTPLVIAINPVAPETINLRNGSTAYVLTKSDAGYTLFKESAKEAFAKLIRSGGGSNYIYSSETAQGNAYFDPNGNLVVEYLDQASGQVISIHYSLQP